MMEELVNLRPADGRQTPPLLPLPAPPETASERQEYEESVQQLHRK